MCGICGFFGFSDTKLIRRMMRQLEHRGPDDSGTFSDGQISLGFQRLSIIDVEGGHQPISNEDGTVTVVFNGEIYNHLELRGELQNHRFSTNSDTEVLVHGYEEWGERLPEKLNGCFAFAIWDSKNKKLFCARDRLGIKPLYYWHDGGKFLFASELKAVLEHSAIERKMNDKAVLQFMNYRYIAGPDTIVSGVKKLMPGHTLSLSKGNFKIQKYWSVEFSPKRLSEKKAAENIRSLLSDSVKMRLMSDVPLGAFLSGGIDSSAIVALMGPETNTFSVGFDVEEVSEASNARRIAEEIGTNHHEIILDKGCIQELPKIIYHLDEPVSDPSAIPIYYLSGLAAKHVKVVLSGEGADELFGGYVHHRVVYTTQKLGSAKYPLNRIMSYAASQMPSGLLDKFFHYPAPLGEAGKGQLIEYLDNLNNIPKAYRALISPISSTDFQELTGKEPPLGLSENGFRNFTSSVLTFEIGNWLPAFMLEKTDKMSMGNSLELRVPFLDHRLVEYAATIPNYFRLRRSSKYIFRKAMAGHMPSRAVYQKKHAYYTPIDVWLEDNKESYKESLLYGSGFNKGYIDKIVGSYSSSRMLYSKQLWGMIMVAIWKKIYIDGEKPRKLDSFL